MPSWKVGRARSHDRVRRPSAVLVQKAAYGLLQRHPQFSAGRGLRPPMAVMLGPFVYLLGLTWITPVIVLKSLFVFSAAYVLTVSLVRLSAALTPARYSPRVQLPESALPRLSIIAALHNEADVVSDLVSGLSQLDYPAHKLDIILVLEAHDHATRLACRALILKYGIRVLVLPPLGPMTKPRALNAAFGVSRGEIIAVYDAEDSPQISQLKAAAEAFAADPELGVVQAPLGWYNRHENWLTAQFALEYAAQFQALLPFYRRMGWPIPLGGTSNVFRRTALEHVGGWDPFNVTEDADLGFRLARSGWKAGLIEPGTLEEAPITLNAWINQRSRWLKGHWITWLVHMRDPRGLIETAGWQAQLCLQFTLLANVLSACLHALIMASVLACACLSITAGLSVSFGLWLVLPAYGAALACALAGGHRAGIPLNAPHLLTMPVYWLLQTPAAFKALRELPRQPYLWRKTQHGVSTAQRTASHVDDDYNRTDGRHRLRLWPGRLAWRTALKPGKTAPDPLDADRHC